MESRVTRALRLPCWHTATTSWLRRSNPDERYFVADQPDLLEPPEHFLDAGQPGPRLLILAIGIGEHKIDASLYGLALPHFVEQVHGSEAARYVERGGVLTSSMKMLFS